MRQALTSAGRLVAAAAFLGLAGVAAVSAQSLPVEPLDFAPIGAVGSAEIGGGAHEPRWEEFSSSVATEGTDGALPAAPDPAGTGGGGFDHYAATAPAAYWHQIPFSRIGVGADVSLLGVGLKAAIVLNQNFDARFLGNYFSYPNANFKVDGFDVTGDVHMASAAVALDWYPWRTIFRISPGVMFYNQNHLAAKGGIAAGTSFTLEGRNYYSATANPVTGATPLLGAGTLGLHRNVPAFTVAGGFGSFVPRSNRHWSFPSEFGVIFMGAPTVDLNVTGWACLDAKQTECTDIGSTTNPISIEFNKNLNAQIQKYRNQAADITVYPIFSYSVVYSFNIR